ncbi:hypothetical protein JCGZ_00167 [Jatropha curcas]|uniref:RNase H type-1 domain-containing protein n=1 Tax=Jatropha curcas TaxID=180498 RepID=A0A067L629_JATCU|nr:hypothetical protein JCGZ_00167 [Jatropha curcas]
MEPLDIGTVKVNCDARIREDNRNGFGMVVRDLNSAIMASGSAWCCSSLSPEEAKAIVVIFALSGMLELGFQSLVLEID